ncbi:MAG TPA: hypothetical protein VES67_10800 [Vicinamibacterales bacterium]|nr:hypothetical protein [Vicinamibacterales bacterium]
MDELRKDFECFRELVGCRDDEAVSTGDTKRAFTEGGDKKTGHAKIGRKQIGGLRMADQTLSPEDREIWFRGFTAAITGILSSEPAARERIDDVLRDAGKIADLALGWDLQRRRHQGGGAMR